MTKTNSQVKVRVRHVKAQMMFSKKEKLSERQNEKSPWSKKSHNKKVDFIWYLV